MTPNLFAYYTLSPDLLQGWRNHVCAYEPQIVDLYDQLDIFLQNPRVVLPMHVRVFEKPWRRQAEQRHRTLYSMALFKVIRT